MYSNVAVSRLMTNIGYIYIVLLWYKYFFKAFIMIQQYIKSLIYIYIYIYIHRYIILTIKYKLNILYYIYIPIPEIITIKW